MAWLTLMRSELMSTTFMRTFCIFVNNLYCADLNPYSKIQRGFDNYEKNTGSKHPNWVQGAVQKRASTGKVTLTDEQEELWQGNIKVGTPAVTFSSAYCLL